MADYLGKSAAEIARAVRTGKASAREVVAEHLAHIQRVDPTIGAFRTVRVEQALLEAEAVDSRADRYALPLAGVPIAIKDNVPVNGEYIGDGSAVTSREIAFRDHEVVRRLRAAGAVVVGLTRVPELCIFPTSDDTDGVARNPWDTARTPGGSSGGSAAAVASGMVPIAHGNDGLGSVRIPAACCGLVGVKPGRGVVPSQLGGGSWSGWRRTASLRRPSRTRSWGSVSSQDGVRESASPRPAGCASRCPAARRCSACGPTPTRGPH